jgi:hypothetical protein
MSSPSVLIGDDAESVEYEPEVIRSFGLNCLIKLESLNQRKPGTLMMNLRTTGAGEASFDEVEKPPSDYWIDETQTAMVSNCIFLANVMSFHTFRRIETAVGKAKAEGRPLEDWKMLSTSGIEKCFDRKSLADINFSLTRQNIGSIAIIPRTEDDQASNLKAIGVKQRRRA